MSDTKVVPVKPKALGTTLVKFDNDGHLIIPNDFTLEVAALMFTELHMVEEKAKTTRFELIKIVVDRFGADAARDLASQYSNISPGYVARVTSIVRNTDAIRKKHPGLGLSQLAVLAPLVNEPEKQARVAEQAAQDGLPAVIIQAIINGTDEQTERLNLALIDLQRALGVLGSNDEYTGKALNVIYQFVRDHGKRKAN